MPTSSRLKTEIRVAAHLRRAQAAGAFAHIARKGDPDAGAIAVKVFMGRLETGPVARLFIQSRNEMGETIWREPFDGPVPEERADDWLARERRIDPDLWIVEVEDRQGRSFVE
ncbi:DUF1491 family protein [Amphiplicatus metriothermophilus]|uniref:DUF1491 domain-containing protein n=1 Tax=Amphiplicatus metriothermophilus TaxID=1519374 RepID=A0A239PZV5_9PROT|nr:DUF1491 family protein [Amphiplicatus metriothermophilus]MBB5518265.1 hypothetical protein [Amphiplicatus metriothermophilus]SNT75496.1 hypothetical protein SAMN06297382_2769 [Amphiplicatus metriothermophilus]